MRASCGPCSTSTATRSRPRATRSCSSAWAGSRRGCRSSCRATLKGRELAAAATVVVRLRLLPDVTLELEAVRPAGAWRAAVPARRGPARRAARCRPASAATSAPRARRGAPARARDARAAAARRRRGGPAAVLPDRGHRRGARAGRGAAGAAAGARGRVDRRASRSSARRSGREALRVQVERKRDWFGIAGELEDRGGPARARGAARRGAPPAAVRARR